MGLSWRGLKVLCRRVVTDPPVDDDFSEPQVLKGIKVEFRSGSILEYPIREV